MTTKTSSLTHMMRLDQHGFPAAYCGAHAERGSRIWRRVDCEACKIAYAKWERDVDRAAHHRRKEKRCHPS